MLAKIYNTEDSTNTLNKNITFVEDIDIKFKEEVNIFKPVITIRYDQLINFNYMYIPEFTRYYFVENVTSYPNKIYTITLKCDVLMSFKDDILTAQGNITAQTNYNEYYNYNYSSEIRKETDIYNSTVTFPDKKSTILSTIGGV